MARRRGPAPPEVVGQLVETVDLLGQLDIGDLKTGDPGRLVRIAHRRSGETDVEERSTGERCRPRRQDRLSSRPWACAPAASCCIRPPCRGSTVSATSATPRSAGWTGWPRRARGSGRFCLWARPVSPARPTTDRPAMPAIRCSSVSTSWPTKACCRPQRSSPRAPFPAAAVDLRTVRRWKERRYCDRPGRSLRARGDDSPLAPRPRRLGRLAGAGLLVRGLGDLRRPAGALLGVLGRLAGRTARPPTGSARRGAARAGRRDRLPSLRPVRLLAPVVGRPPARRPTAASASWATCRSTRRSTAPRSGATASCSISIRTAVRDTSPACRPTPTARTASCGGIRSTAGTACATAATVGGSSGCGTPSPRPTWCASTISAPSPATGRCRATPRPRRAAAGARARGTISSPPCARRWGTCPSSPRTWA